MLKRITRLLFAPKAIDVFWAPFWSTAAMALGMSLIWAPAIVLLVR
ncbi:MAG: hypothetical protein IH621_09000 [Krumholzibacteria bacterium]|nr:hypothetical protein [Candidatus Krumholzibacteria bacterium]